MWFFDGSHNPFLLQENSLSKSDSKLDGVQLLSYHFSIICDTNWFMNMWHKNFDHDLVFAILLRNY